MFIKCIYKSIRHQAYLNIHIRQIKDVQSHGHSEWRTKDKDSNVKYKIKCHLAEGGEREQWVFLTKFVSCEKKKPLLFTEKTSEWRICPNPDIKTKITASSVPFQVFFLRKMLFKSLPLQSISTLWLGYCSCSCCWCQREATPRYLASHWSLSPPCHHRVMLRLEEDDNGRSKQRATTDSLLPTVPASSAHT